MSALVLRFPPRRRVDVVVVRERGGRAWLTILHAHGWAFGSRAAAVAAALELGRQHGLRVLEELP